MYSIGILLGAYSWNLWWTVYYIYAGSGSTSHRQFKRLLPQPLVRLQGSDAPEISSLSIPSNTSKCSDSFLSNNYHKEGMQEILHQLVSPITVINFETGEGPILGVPISQTHPSSLNPKSKTLNPNP